MRYVIHLAYNGANYCGWQTQPELPTVQQTLEQALSTLLHCPIAVVGCGRTDSGVHASDYYAHFDSPDMDSGNEEPAPIDRQKLVFKLNSLLPPDIAIFDIFPVTDNFHARFSATARTYQYHVSNKRLPFAQGLYYRTFYNLDVDAMNKAAQVLLQYDDFSSFAKSHTDVKTNICHLTEAHWDYDGDQLVFTIKSNRFLRNMVRSITGTLLDVGRGKMDIDAMCKIVEKKDRSAAGVSMPAQGLFLTHIEYPWEEYVMNGEW